MKSAHNLEFKLQLLLYHFSRLCCRNMMPNRISFCLARLICGLALALCMHIAGADTRNEIWPELDGFFKLDERMRLFLMAASTRSEEKEVAAGAARIESRQVGASVDFTLKPIFRVSLREDDWERNRYLWLRVGYRYLDNPNKTSTNENRGLVEFYSLAPLPAD